MTAEFNPGYQIIHYTEDTILPESGTYYVVAGNGVFLHKDRGLIKGLIPVDGVDFLKDMENKVSLKWTGPKIPHDLVYKIKRFFRIVVDKYRAEACVILYFNHETNDWGAVVPVQQVSHGSVAYKREAIGHLVGDYIPAGTIHSHADFGAFHSGTDVGDEATFDGLHITFGHNQNDAISISASIAMNGHRLQIDPLSVLDKMFHADEGYSMIRETVTTEWLEKANQEVDCWLLNVSDMYGSYSVAKSGEELCIGDKVVWEDNIGKTWQRTYGDGPFEILSLRTDDTMGDVAEMRANVQGPMIFPVSFFKRA